MSASNEATMQWVGESELGDQPARSTIDETVLAGRWAVLELEFVDTFAEVFAQRRPRWRVSVRASSATAST